MRIVPNQRRVKVWLVLLALAVVVPMVGYWLWSPGQYVDDGRNDRGTNGIWMSHRWLGDDTWFIDNDREHLQEQYRDPAFIESNLSMLRDRGITDLFPHLAPTKPNGQLPDLDEEQLNRFLATAAQNNQRVIPWVGGVFELHCHPSNPEWRKTFIQSITTLLEDHARLAGIQLNIEPWPSGDADCLLLLDELKAVIPKGKILSIAAYPPPTKWQPAPEVHWDESYFREVARRSDQLAVMMYDTSIPLEKHYIALMDKWTREVLAWSEGTPILLGLPCYADQAVDYHNPNVENLANALAGVHAGLIQNDLPKQYQGVALYSLWEIDDQEWSHFDRHYRSGPD